MPVSDHFAAGNNYVLLRAALAGVEIATVVDLLTMAGLRAGYLQLVVVSDHAPVGQPITLVCPLRGTLRFGVCVAGIALRYEDPKDDHDLQNDLVPAVLADKLYAKRADGHCCPMNQR